MSADIKLGKITIGANHPPLLIAEMSGNHDMEIKKAREIIKAAAKAGAGAIKLQTYTPDTITLDCKDDIFLIGGDETPVEWRTKTLHELYQTIYTPWEWHGELKELAESLGLLFFSTPFDLTAVDFLEDLGVLFYKIASYEATDITLLRRVAATGKPVIMSVGFATLPEIELSVKTLRDHGTVDLVLLHCTTSYSDTVDVDHTNLRIMHDLAKRFDVLTGFSDNMGGIEAPVLAANMGAVAIEKHFVIGHGSGGADEKFSIDTGDFTMMVKQIRNDLMVISEERKEKLMGKVSYGPQTTAEEHNRRFRRSLFAIKDIKKGETFTEKNVHSKRPSNGLPTKYCDVVWGAKATRDIVRCTPLSWDLVEGGERV